MESMKNENLSKEEVMAVILETTTYKELKAALLNKFNLKEEIME